MARFAVLCVLVAVAINGGFADEPDRLINGQAASINEYPHVVSIRSNNRHICGGAIVGPQEILTAAHCLVPFAQKISQLTVVTGAQSIKFGGEKHTVSKLFYHTKYKSNPKAHDNSYDIGIIKLASKIVYNDRQRAIPLPVADIPVGVDVTVTAWGATSYPKGPLSSELQKLELRTIDLNVCKNYHRHVQTLSSLQFCTYKAYGTGTCQGDSGSPLIYQGRIVGVVSNGIPCAVGFPDVMSNVYKLLDFVNAALKQ